MTRPKSKLTEKQLHLLSMGPMPTGVFSMHPNDTYYIYAFDSKRTQIKVKLAIQGRLKDAEGRIVLPPLFPPPGSIHRRVSPIDDIWTRKYQREWAGVVGALRVIVPGYSSPYHQTLTVQRRGKWIQQPEPVDTVDYDMLFVDMMSVRPAFRRRGVNTVMIEAALKMFGRTRVEFSKPTNDGKAFIATSTWKPREK